MLHPKIILKCSPSENIKPSTEITSINYSLFFNVADLNPKIGMTYRIFVDQRFISFMHPPVIDRRLSGFIHYSPESDLVAVIMHTGCLFPDPKSKETTHRQFQTVTNLFETMCCSETEYHKRAVIYHIHNDVRIKGILVTILICPSPLSFQETNRNGIRSHKSSASTFSYRISDFRILTKFDKMPKIVAIKDYVSRRIIQPLFHLSFTGEVGIKYSKEIFDQFISQETIINGLFEVYRIFFDSNGNRYEIKTDDNLSFTVLRLIDPVMIDIIKRKASSGIEVEKIVENIEFDDIIAGDTYIRFNSVLIRNIDTLSLMNIPGKISRSPSLRLGE